MRQWARVSTPGLEALVEHFDKVGWEEPDHATVALQTSHPPGPVARVETFDQVALDEAEIAFRLEWLC
jgi:hypothetical protein